jgi:hypothetical protein
MKLNKIYSTFAILTILSIHLKTAKAQSIDDLKFLIGTWEVNEVIYPGTEKEFTESGTRTCAYFVDSTYIQCITNATNKYRERTYVMMFNYAKKYNKYIVTSLFSDHSFQGVYEWYLDSAKQTIQCISPLEPNEDEFYRGDISISENQLIWKGFKTTFRNNRTWESVYIETSTRLK